MIHIKYNEVRIELYESLLNVSDNVMEVCFKEGIIRIIGDNLRIVAMNDEEMVCMGKIREVIFL